MGVLFIKILYCAKAQRKGEEYGKLQRNYIRRNFKNRRGRVREKQGGVGMGYNFIKDHTSVNFSSGNAGRKYIVYHYTGNMTDTAKANANYFRNLDRGASAHYFVDDNDIYEVVSPSDTSWAVGVNENNGRLFGICTNYNSINIEMCSVNGEITRKTQENAAALGRSLVNRYGIPGENIVRHYDVCGKRCPGWAGWVPGDESKWIAFKKLITENKGTNQESINTFIEEEDTMKCFYTIDGKGPVMYFDGYAIHPVAHQDEVNILNKIYKDCTGKDIPCYSWSSKAPWFARLEAVIARKKS